jgi:hypothetical protein
MPCPRNSLGKQRCSFKFFVLSADVTAKPHTDNLLNSSGNSQGTFSGNSEAVVVDDRCSPKGIFLVLSWGWQQTTDFKAL